MNKNHPTIWVIQYIAFSSLIYSEYNAISAYFLLIYTNGINLEIKLNFLAHQSFSFDSKPVMVGNFIADTVTGSISDAYSHGIQLGIHVHRAIDQYTDSHPIVLETRKLLYPHFGKYAAVVQDVYYDHFLAIHWGDYRDDRLKDFVQQVYALLNTNKDIMNAKALRILHYMELHDWLTNYANTQGIDRALRGLSHRASFPSNMENGIPPLIDNFNALNQHFITFFPELENEINTRVGQEIQETNLRPQTDLPKLSSGEIVKTPCFIGETRLRSML